MGVVPETSESPPLDGEQQPGYACRGQMPRRDDRALGAMITGIVALALPCGIMLAPVALFTGRSARERIDASNGQLTGRGMAQAAFVMGVIGTVILGLAVVGGVVAFVADLRIGSSR